MSDKYRRKLLPEQIAEIIRLREEKRKQPAVIAPLFGVTESTVNYHLLRNGVDPWDPEKSNGAHQPNGFSPEEDERMLELGRQGLSPFKIAKAIGRAKTSTLIRILTLEVRAEKALEVAA